MRGCLAKSSDGCEDTLFPPAVNLVSTVLGGWRRDFKHGLRINIVAAGLSGLQELAENEEYNEREDEFDSNPRDDEAPSCAPPPPPRPARHAIPDWLERPGLCRIMLPSCAQVPSRQSGCLSTVEVP